MNRIHFLRAVWSDIILVESQGKYALIDTGFADAFESRIDPYLKELGVKKLEFIFLTHFHKDHYGSLPAILDHYPVDTVYMKKFSGLNITTSNGRGASDEYNLDETRKCEEMCEKAKKLSRLVVIDGSFDHVRLGDFDFRLFGTTDAIREMYEDPASPYYQQIRFGENTNSVALFTEVDGTTIYLGGDCGNEALEYEKYDRPNDRYAREVGKPIDLMKVPHHCCGNIFSDEALAVLRPRWVVATNWTASVYSQFLGNVEKLRQVQPGMKLLISDRCGYVFTIGKDGALGVSEIQKVPEITLEEIPAPEGDTSEAIDEFWDLHIHYLIDDGIIDDPEDVEYFQSDEYRGTIIQHMKREENKHHLAYFIREGKRIGACSYCLYPEEDQKCFILDYWVFRPFRGAGTGHHCFTALVDYTRMQGARIYEINASTVDGIRFWKAHGFVDNGVDEWGMPLFIRR